MKRLKKNEIANKLIEKIPDPHNAKEHYQSFIRKKKNTKSVQQSPKIFENTRSKNFASIIQDYKTS